MTTLTDRETFLVIFAESANLPNRMEWVKANLKPFNIEFTEKEIEEIITEYHHIQSDLIVLAKSRRKKMEDLITNEM